MHHLPVNFPPETPHCDSNPGIQSLELISRRKKNPTSVKCTLVLSQATLPSVSADQQKQWKGVIQHSLFPASGIKKAFCVIRVKKELGPAPKKTRLL